MLRLKNITKDYVTKGVPTVHALRGISLNFRRKEFVAILGQSGCGKTTTLNIIGGLDRYTDGDLVIEGRSTKEYKDGDWDTYRNHSVGFVFQSYNLIMHQSVLKNVELALTISGVARAERRERALKMLERVGLAGMEGKKPNQLSGGQMQRVAIARALINNPEILLADEPTGALDSETSVQIMDLLKEVASNCLVIMVTHNPDLAKAYATRIVTMSDGKITSDSNPYEGESEAQRNAAHANDVYTKGKKKNSSMSFLTATGLSFSNLLSKLSRTILVAIAGSIGIIGVSTVLSVSNGVNTYIDSMQGDMMSAYPLTIAEESVDYTSLLGGLENWDSSKNRYDFDITTRVGLDSLIEYLMEKYKDVTSVKTNDINLDLLDFVTNGAPEKSYTDLVYHYGIDPTNNIFADYTRHHGEASSMVSLNGLTQMYISELKTVDGFSEYAAFVDLFTDFMKEMPSNQEYILDQYDLVGTNSRFAQNENEIMLVVDQKQTLTDLVYAQLGFYNEDDFLNLAQKAIEENKENPDQSIIDKCVFPHSFTFDEILGKKMAYYPHDAMWEYSSVTRNYVRFTVPKELIEREITFNVYYHENTDRLEGKMIIDKSIALDVSIPRQANTTFEDPARPWTGTWFLNFNEYQFPFRVGADNIVYTYALDKETKIPQMVPLGPYTTETKDTKGYMYPAFAKKEWESQKTDLKIVGILKPKPEVRFGCLSRGVYYTAGLAKKYMADALHSKIVENEQFGIEAHIRSYITKYGEEIEPYKAYVTYPYTSWADMEHPVLISDGMANALNGNNGLSSLLSITSASSMSVDQSNLRALAGLKTVAESAYEGITTGYHFESLPRKLSIYLQDFAQKDRLTQHLDTWNKDGDITVFKGTPNQHTLSKAERAELTYTDTIGMIITVVDYLINAITIALIMFVSLALVVSCFMIAVITFISTMERVKEIGVIRSLGGRKLDVSRLFIAECLITGLASGLLGIIVTYAICIVANIIVAPFGVTTIAILAPLAALAMVGLSVLLNVLSGLIPSMRASNQDPVKALRTE